MRNIIKLIVLFCVVFISINVNAQLVLPKNVVGLSTQQGQDFLKESKSKYSQQYWKLSEFFTTEYGTSFCGPASVVMVLNSLGAEAPIAPSHQPYTIYDQTNLFYNKKLIDKGIVPTKVYAQGLTIDETADLINFQNSKKVKLKAKVMHANDFTSVSGFKAKLKKAISSGKYIILNYNRADMGAQGGGHFSPLAAYNEKNDSWLLMDVARYKYEPAWIKTSDIYKAILEKDSGSNKPRGVIIVSKLG